MKSALDTRNLGFKLEPEVSKKKTWSIVQFSISDYEGYPVTRKSINGIVLYILDMPASWQSKGQGIMALSSSETLCVVILSALKKLIFVVKLLQSLNMSVKLMIVLRVDDVGAIFVAFNVTATNHTKHVDTKFN